MVVYGNTVMYIDNEVSTSFIKKGRRRRGYTHPHIFTYLYINIGHICTAAPNFCLPVLPTGYEPGKGSTRIPIYLDTSYRTHNMASLEPYTPTLSPYLNINPRCPRKSFVVSKDFKPAAVKLDNLEFLGGQTNHEIGHPKCSWCLKQ